MKQFTLKNIMLGVQGYNVWANSLQEAKELAVQGHTPHNDNHAAYWINIRV